MQQIVSLGDIAHMTRGAAHGVHQSRFSIDANVSLHAKVPLIALLAGVRLGVACLVFVLGRTRRWDKGGVDCQFHLQQQAALAQLLINDDQYLLCEFVFF